MEQTTVTYTQVLDRIADTLERIANALESFNRAAIREQNPDSDGFVTIDVSGTVE